MTEVIGGFGEGGVLAYVVTEYVAGATVVAPVSDGSGVLFTVVEPSTPNAIPIYIDGHVPGVNVPATQFFEIEGNDGDGDVDDGDDLVMLLS